MVVYRRIKEGVLTLAGSLIRTFTVLVASSAHFKTSMAATKIKRPMPVPSELPQTIEPRPSPVRVPDVIKLSCRAVRLIGRSPGRGGVAMQSRHYRSMISRKHASIRFDCQLTDWVIQDLEVCVYKSCTWFTIQRCSCAY